jgi:hypothetical protein
VTGLGSVATGFANNQMFSLYAELIKNVNGRKKLKVKNKKKILE